MYIPKRVIKVAILSTVVLGTAYGVNRYLQAPSNSGYATKKDHLLFLGAQSSLEVVDKLEQVAREKVKSESKLLREELTRGNTAFGKAAREAVKASTAKTKTLKSSIAANEKKALKSLSTNTSKVRDPLSTFKKNHDS